MSCCFHELTTAVQQQLIVAQLLSLKDTRQLVLADSIQYETEKLLNSDFVNVCQWFIDNKIKIHFAEEDTKVIILRSEDKLAIHNTIHNPNGLKLLTRFRLGLSHLNEHKFNYNFKDCVNLFMLLYFRG